MGSQILASCHPRKPYSLDRIFDLWQQGKTHQEIADDQGISSSRVGQLLGMIPEYRDCPSKAWPPARRAKAVAMYQAGLSATEIAGRLKAKACKVASVLKQEGIELRPRGFSTTGHKNPAWKGGVKISGGYVYYYHPTHPKATKSGYVLLHRLVMQAYLVRPLEDSEVVHHKDEDTMNNCIDNLELFSSNSEHLAKTLAGKCPNWTPEGREKLRAIAADPERIRKSIEARRRKSA